jgi:hypothetical protein
MSPSIPALLQPLKDRLAAATPGPWDWNHSNPRRVLEGRGGVPVLSCAALLYPERLNAEFIASAPTDQAKLIAAIEAAAALADAWQGRGEHLLEFSKTAPEDVAEALFTDAGSMLHTASLVRAALTQALGGNTA